MDHLLIGSPRHGVVLDGGLAEFYSRRVKRDIFILRGSRQKNVLEQMQVGVLGEFVHEGFPDIWAIF